MTRRRCYYRGTTLLDDLQQIAKDVLCETLPEDKATSDSIKIVCAFRDQFSGVFTQIPSGAHCLTEARDASVEAAFRGNNHAALAKQFGVSTDTIRAILRRRRST